MARSLDFAPLFFESMRKIGLASNIIYKPSTINKLSRRINKYSKILLGNPLLGSKELLLEDLLFDYRKVVIKPWFKLIYAFTDTKLYLIDVWDTRQNPDTLIDRVSEINLNTL